MAVFQGDSNLSYAVGEAIPSVPWQRCWERFRDVATRYPTNIALVCTHQPANLLGITSQPLDTPAYEAAPYLRWTYKQLEETVGQLARRLAKHKIGPGVPVFCFLPNCAEFIIIHWATFMLGAVLVPLGPWNLENETEFTHKIRTALLACSDKPGAVFAADEKVMKQLSLFVELNCELKVVVSNAPTEPQCIAFDKLLYPPISNSSQIDQIDVGDERNAGGAVLFTSGTTALPKGCHWTDAKLASYLKMQYAAAIETYSLGPGDVAALVSPNTHAIGFTNIATCHGTGATVLYLGVAFDPMAFLRHARSEKLTHAAVVRPMVFGLLQAKKNLDLGFSHLKSLILGGTLATPELVKLCSEGLESPSVEVVYGSTEGVTIRSGKTVPEKLICGPDVVIGRCMPGCRVKICAPDSRIPILRDQPGELHFTSPAIVEGYIGQKDGGFYTDEEGVRWQETGDQVVMKSDGRLFVVGRYKDMITRSGPSINPESIEAVVNRDMPQLVDAQVQVVGAPDKLAGEVPMAITLRRLDSETKKQLQDTVLVKLGQQYAVEDVVAIQDLGLEQYPRTSLGKVKKAVLRELVAQHVQQKTAQHCPDAAENLDLAEQSKVSWAQGYGITL